MPEVIEKRTRNSKTHDFGGNKFAWDGTIGAIHYEDNGWQEIDNIFEPAVAPWDWQMLKAGYHIRVKNDFTAGQIIEFEKQGETVQFQPMALEWTNDLDQIQQVSMPQNVASVITNPVVDLLPAVGVPSHQGTIRWDNAYGSGIDFEWKCTSSRLVKILQVNSFASLPVPAAYIISGGNPVLRLNLIFAPSTGADIYVDGAKWNKSTKKQTFNIVEFVKDGEVLWGFMPLRYWGSGEAEDNEGQSVATLEKRGNKLYVSIRVPHSWLQSAVYPVFIDTDVDEEIVAGADDGCTRGDTGAYDNSGVGVFVGNYSATSSDEDSWYRFQTVTITNGATIDVAYVELYVATWDTGNNEKIWADDQSNPAAPTNYADHRGRTRTTNGVQWTLDNTWDKSGSIVAIIQELVDSYDYSGGANAIQILFDANAVGDYKGAIARSYEYDTTLAAKLHIEYSVGGVTHEGAATLSGVGTLASIGRGIFVGKSALSGTGTLASIGHITAIGKATLSGIGTLVAAGTIGTIQYGTAMLSGIGSLAASAVSILVGKATLSGTGDLAAKGVGTFIGKAILTGTGTLAGIGRLIATGKATLVGTGLLTANGVIIAIGKATLEGVGVLVGKGIITAIGKATLAGVGTLSAAGRGIFVGTTTLVGAGSLATNAVLVAIGKATASGIGTLSVIGTVITAGAGILKKIGLTLRSRSLILHLDSLKPGLPLRERLPFLTLPKRK